MSLPLRRDDWLTDIRPSLEGRQALAAAWQADALNEHASIASFARFALELLGVGAPAELVSRAQQAMADEVRHAKLSFALASAYAGQPLGHGALAIDGGSMSRDLAGLAASTAIEGCINETLAALVAGAARDAATDHAVGRLSELERWQVIERGLREVVMPCARAVLGHDVQPPLVPPPIA